MNTEPKVNKRSTCPYCGDAPMYHPLAYLESFVSTNLDPVTVKVAKHAPNFIKRFVDQVPVFLFTVMSLLGLVSFSSDINKATSFRSRVIWQEAIDRGIKMEQVVVFGRPIDHYRATINGKRIYFESIPLPAKFLDMDESWDDKVILKNKLAQENIPVPDYFKLPILNTKNLEKYFEKLEKPIIVKPRLGSRARHTVTNINTFVQFKDGVALAKKISPYIVVEEHLMGHVCRATLVGGKLGGFYQGQAPTVKGDGTKTVRDLIAEKDSAKQKRVENIRLNEELYDHVSREGYKLDDILPLDKTISLSHRRGRLFGGTTREMIDELHPSFVPILEKAAKVVGLSVVGFDCIIPDPTKDEASQRWGIIECNTLPFIDLHYYALEGKPRNIAGMIWDLWK